MITPNFPMTLHELADELEKTGIELMVYRAGVEYDERIGITDIFATLECRAVDLRPDEDKPEDAYERAMGVLGK